MTIFFSECPTAIIPILKTRDGQLAITQVVSGGGKTEMQEVHLETTLSQ